MPFGTLIALFMLWFGISVPLVFVGSYFGYKKHAPDDPVRTNKIPRQIPEQVRCRRCSCPMPMQRLRAVDCGALATARSKHAGAGRGLDLGAR